VYRQNGTPVRQSTESGSVIEKAVTRYTVSCPDCDIPAIYDEDSEPICPNCGAICGASAGGGTYYPDQIVRDAKAAGRLPEAEGASTSTE
jgi:ribosomal protein S27E